MMLSVATVAGVATGLGAIPTLFGAGVSHKVDDASLGLAGAIMVAASMFGPSFRGWRRECSGK
jgi:ZIP family zinc transporter